MTVSTDGNAFWWDIRKLHDPIEQLSLKEKNSETLLGGVALEYDPTAGLTKFMIGTEQGQQHFIEYYKSTVFRCYIEL